MLPVQDPILVFALTMSIFLLAPFILERYALPGIVGILVLGAIVGPNGFGILERTQLFVLLGEVGLVYLMFIAGLEINYSQFVTHKERSATFGILSFLIPQGAGTFVGVTYLELSLPAALLFGAIFSSHTVLAYPIVTRYRLTENDAMTTTVGGTILTDTLALLVLAIVIAGYDGGLTARYWIELVIGIVLVLGGIWVVVPRVAGWFFGMARHDSVVEFLFVLAVLFLAAFLSDVAGIKHIIGAFIVGLAFNRLIPKTGPLMNRLEFVGNAFFIPFFLVSVGMLVDLRGLADRRTILIAGALIGLVIGTKFIAAWVTSQLFRYTQAERLGMFGLSVGQAAAALAIVLIAFDAGIAGFDQSMLNAVVVMIFVISILSPIIVERSGTAILREGPQKPDPGPETADTILLTVPEPDEGGTAYLDFASLIRGREATEPIYLTSVVQPTAERERVINQVDIRHNTLETYAAGADIPIESRIAVDADIATGIVRVVAENRIDLLVLPWDGSPSRYRRVFGSVIDRVIELTDIALFVSVQRRPIESTDRLLVILPANCEHAPTFTRLVNRINSVATGLGASIAFWTLSDHPEHVRDVLDTGSDLSSYRLSVFATWNEIRTTIRETATETDHIVLVSARRNAVGWHRGIETFPSYVASHHGGNVSVAFPATYGTDDDRQFFQVY